MFAINRDARIATCRKIQLERSQALANHVPGTRAHGRLLAECEAISDQIAYLQGCISIPRGALTAGAVLLVFLVLVLLG